MFICLSHPAIALEISSLNKSPIISPESIAVFYPNAKQPYRSIYQDIVLGCDSLIKNQKYPPIKLKSFLLEKEFDIDKIIADLKRQKIKKVIVLGRSGYKLAKLLPKEFSVVSGALPISPNGVSGISLMSDPKFLFDYLANVAPDVKRVHIAYSKKNEWIIQLAKTAAANRGLTLNLKKVKNTKQAVQFYQQVFDSKVSKQDAIWLPLDRVSSHDKITLPIILEKAWAKGMVVFSSKPSHAKRGVLFSTYPDNYSLGQHLYLMVKQLAKQPAKRRFSPLSAMKLAVNLRTAAHLGFKYTSEQQQSFKLTFPE